MPYVSSDEGKTWQRTRYLDIGGRGDHAGAARKIAAIKNVELIDVCALYETYDRQAGKSMNDLLLDGMHPNSAGHRLVADLLLEKIPDLLKSRVGCAPRTRSCLLFGNEPP